MDQDQQDFAAKLTVIEWGANLVLEDSPPSPIRDRVQNIATVARVMRLRLDVATSRVQEDFAAKLVLIEIQTSRVLDELPPGVMRDGMQRIAAVVRLLRQDVVPAKAGTPFKKQKS
jgi:hypothetical protein